MKKLKDCYDEIYKCSKCGLCQGVCPVFKITKNEAALSRGKFLMLLSYLDGKIPMSKTMRKYLDMCTSCGACTKFCPSGIDAAKIFNLAKFETKKFSLKFLFNFAISILSRSKSDPNDTHEMPAGSPSGCQIVYFQGCFSKCVSEKMKKSTLNILKKLKFDVKIPKFDCCGIVAQSLGDKKMFEEQFKYNVDVLKSCKDAQYIVFDCATCLETIKNYDKYFEIDGFEEIKSKCISLLELLEIKKVKFKSEKSCKITYHKPCHMEFDVQNLLKSIENADYIQMADFDSCCGFAGEFAIKNTKLAINMFKNKAENIDKTSCDSVLTFCPSCVLGLNAAKKFAKKKFKVQNVVEFLDMLEIIA